MKSLYKSIVLASVVVAGLASCNKAEFTTYDIVSFSNARYTVKENDPEVKIPVSIFSDKATSAVVTYQIKQGEDYAVLGTDYTLEGTGVLNISNVEGAVCDSIVIKPISQVGTLQGNKKIVIELEQVTTSGLHLGSTTSCTVTIVDVDGGVNLLVGDWEGSNLKTNKNAGAIAFSLETVEGVADYPQANVKIAKGASFTDAIGNKWDTSYDIYAYFDDSKSLLTIYHGQFFAGGNFGEDIGVLVVAIETQDGSDLVWNVEDGIMTLTQDMYFNLYDTSGNDSGYNCGAIKAGEQIKKK